MARGSPSIPELRRERAGGNCQGFFRVDVHGEFFVHKNVPLLRQTGFVQSLASPELALMPRPVSS